jgi:cytochrome b pre-mRNA-processing protein 3
MSMIFNLFRKSPMPDGAVEGYAAIVAQSRQEKFYADWGVPDTVTGRFDMITLHLALLLHRLKGDASARPFGQALVDIFFRDMDGSIRELGVTDLGVPNKIKKMGNVFYGMVEALGLALDNGSQAEIEALFVRNIYGAPNAGAALLAAHVLAEASRLAATPTATLIRATGAAA